MVDSVVAGNVRRIIQERGMKNKAVAEKAGYSESQFSAILSNRRVIKAIDVAAISDALGVTPNDLFASDGESA